MPSFRQGTAYKLRIVPSGYEFLGPGNEISYNVPRNYNDVVAKYHDIAYRDLIARGIDPYTTYSQADGDFLNSLDPDDFVTYVAKGIFESKKFLANAGVLATGMFILQYASQTKTRSACY